MNTNHKLLRYVACLLVSVLIGFALMGCQNKETSQVKTESTQSTPKIEQLNSTITPAFSKDLEQMFRDSYATVLGEPYEIVRFAYDDADLLDPGTMPLDFAVKTQSFQVQARGIIDRNEGQYSLIFSRVDLTFNPAAAEPEGIEIDHLSGKIKVFDGELELWAHQAGDRNFELDFKGAAKFKENGDEIEVPVQVRAENAHFSLQGEAKAVLTLGPASETGTTAYAIGEISGANCLEAKWVAGRIEMPRGRIDAISAKPLDPFISIDLLGMSWGVEDGFAGTVMQVDTYNDYRDIKLEDVRFFENGKRFLFSGSAILYNRLSSYKVPPLEASAELEFSGRGTRENPGSSSFTVSELDKPLLKNIQYNLAGYYAPVKNNFAAEAVLLPDLKPAEYFYVVDDYFIFDQTANAEGDFPFTYRYDTLAYEGLGQGPHSLSGVMDINVEDGSFVLQVSGWNEANDLSVPAWSGVLEVKSGLGSSMIYPMITHLNGEELASSFRLEAVAEMNERFVNERGLDKSSGSPRREFVLLPETTEVSSETQETAASSSTETLATE